VVRIVPGVRLREVELRRCRLPLREPFRTSYGTDRERAVLLVRVGTDAGGGWGECGAPATPGYTGEALDGALAVLRDRIVPALWGRDLDPLGRGASAMLAASVPGHPMARAALELALLDAALRAEGRSVADWLGATAARVPGGIALGVAASGAAARNAVEHAVGQGYGRVKLKIEPGADVEPLRAVRAAFESLTLHADANGAYRFTDADHLAQLDPIGLECLEQPLPRDDLEGHAALARRLTTPICLDESITSAADAVRAVELGACRVVNVKAARVGGLAEARALHDACAARGVDLWVGGMLDTGIARAANVALAALPGITMTGDVSASDRWFTTELTEPLRLDAEGCLAVPRGPGLGVEVDVTAVESVTEEVVRLTP
jgi:O-succinylbenzoate synthase